MDYQTILREGWCQQLWVMRCNSKISFIVWVFSSPGLLSFIFIEFYLNQSAITKHFQNFFPWYLKIYSTKGKPFTIVLLFTIITNWNEHIFNIFLNIYLYIVTSDKNTTKQTPKPKWKKWPATPNKKPNTTNGHVCFIYPFVGYRNEREMF